MTEKHSAPPSSADSAKSTDQDEPQPWRTPEDAAGWHTIPRVHGRRTGPPLIRVSIDLDADQSAWLRAESQRTGLGYDELVLKALDEARSATALQVPTNGTSR